MDAAQRVIDAVEAGARHDAEDKAFLHERSLKNWPLKIGNGHLILKRNRPGAYAFNENFQSGCFHRIRAMFIGGAAILVCASAGAANVPDTLIDAITKSDFAYQRLARLCDTFGPRFSGSTNLEAAIDWILAQMKKDGLENVHGEEVMVPHWVRGAESAELLAPRARRLPMLGLGGSIATPPEGVTAEVLVVKSFAELTERAGEAANKIVLFQCSFHHLRRHRRHSQPRRGRGGAGWGGGQPDSLGRAVFHPVAAHRQHVLQHRGAQNSARRHYCRGRGHAAAHAGSRRKNRRPSHHERRDTAGRSIQQ